MSFRKDLAVARARLASVPSSVYESTFGDIEYLLEGAGPTVLVCHGVTGGVDQGIRLARDFRILPNGCRFLYVSRFGYLRSWLPEHASAQRQASAYLELLDHLDIRRAFVFGNSAGGPSVMWFAIDSPERTQGLILVSSVVPGARVAPTPGPVFKHDLLYKNAFEAALPITRRSHGVFFDNGISTPSIEDIPFERIAAPTLIVHAVDDPAPPIAGARAVAARIPRCDLVTLDGGHLLLRRGDDARRAIERFIAQNP